jgi:hypothetical protein
MGSNPIIGTSANAFCEGKLAKITSSIDCACSRIKTHGLLIYLPSFAKWNSCEHAVTLHYMHYNFCRIHQTPASHQRWKRFPQLSIVVLVSV